MQPLSLQAVHVCGKEMLDQLNFLLKSHSSCLPPISYPPPLSLSFPPFLSKYIEVQIYGAARSLVATVQPEKVICSVITDTEQGERSVNGVMDKREKEGGRMWVSLQELVSVYFNSERQPWASVSIYLKCHALKQEVFHSQARKHCESRSLEIGLIFRF